MVGRAHWFNGAGVVFTGCILCGADFTDTIDETCLHVLCECPATQDVRKAETTKLRTRVVRWGGKAEWVETIGPLGWFRLMLGWPDEELVKTIKEKGALQYPRAAAIDPVIAVRHVVHAAVVAGVAIADERNRLFGETLNSLEETNPPRWQLVKRTVSGPDENPAESDPSSDSDAEGTSNRRELWERRYRSMKTRRAGAEPDWAEDHWTVPVGVKDTGLDIDESSVCTPSPTGTDSDEDVVTRPLRARRTLRQDPFA